MSDRDLPPSQQEQNEENQAPRGINLWLAYGLILLGLLLAIGAATLIVLPFYQHRH